MGDEDFSVPELRERDAEEMSVKESEIQRDIRIRLSEIGGNLFLRYNVGTFLTMDGRPVKIGVPGVSDLIGCVSRKITEEDVGKTVAVFTVIETKQEKDHTAAERKRKQGAFIARVRELGGMGGIARSVKDAEKIISEL